jgi:hypothetical protein
LTIDLALNHFSIHPKSLALSPYSDFHQRVFTMAEEKREPTIAALDNAGQLLQSISTRDKVLKLTIVSEMFSSTRISASFGLCP